MTEATDGESDPAESVRPLREVPQLPSKKDRRSFQLALERRGSSPESASAVARAVTNPALANAIIESPTLCRVPGAELEVVRLDVFSTRVVADATNPRTLNKILFPAAVAPGPDQRARFAPIRPPVSAGPDDFSLIVDSVDQLVWQLDETMKALCKENVPRPSIAQQGVMEPPLAVSAKVATPDFTPMMGLVLVREGSSRVSHVHRIMDVTARDVLLRFVDDRAQQSLIDELNALALGPASELSEADAARIRVATMPLDLVVGVRPDPGSSVTLGEAVAAKVAQDHLNHKKQWEESAKDVHVGEECLIALRDEGLLSDERYDWLAGRLPSDVASVDGEAVGPGDRWAELLWLFTTSKQPHARIIRKPIATVLEREGGRTSVRNRDDRIPVAVALAMRERRGLVTDAAVDRESKVLASSVPTEAWQRNWRLTNGKTARLKNTALEAADARGSSTEGIELTVRAAWFLTIHGQVAMPRNDLGPGGDRRSPSELLEDMLKTRRGVEQLARSVDDGREGKAAGAVVDAEGNIDVSGVGTPVVLSDANVRQNLAPKSGPPMPTPRDPMEEYLDALASFSRRISDAIQSDSDLRAVEDGRGGFLYESAGMIPSQAAELRRHLTALAAHLDEYERTWRVKDAVEQGGESQVDGE